MASGLVLGGKTGGMDGSGGSVVTGGGAGSVGGAAVEGEGGSAVG
jgi:hypothetical protein